MGEIDADLHPVIKQGLRLQWETAQQTYVLLYPEGMVKLNASAAAILTRCDGVRAVADIIKELEQDYAAELGNDIRIFIALALERNWLEPRP